MNSSALRFQKGFSALLLIIPVALLVLGSAAVWFFNNQTQTSNAPEKSSYEGPAEKLKIGNIGEYTIFNLIAKEQGYFADNGVDAEIKEYTSGPAALAGLQAGEVDINIAADFVGVRNLFANKDLRILAHVNQHRVFQLAARKDLGINTPADLKGKKIGVTKNSAGEYFIGDFLTTNGLDISDIQMVDLPPADMLTQLEEGKIDAIAVFEPHIFRLKQKPNLDLTTWEIQGNQNIHALVFTTKSFLEKNPDLVERYLKSLIEAEGYYKSNPEAVKEFIAQKLSYEKAYVDYSWPRFTHEIGLKQELILNMETEARWIIKNGLTDQKEVPNFLDFIYFDALEKIKPAVVNITHT